MNKRLLIIVIVVVVAVLAFLIRPRAPVCPTLRLYAGAGLRPAVEKLVTAFAKQTGIRVEPDYGGSGLMLARARDDKQADLFMPGDAWYVTRLQTLAGNVAEQATVARLVPVIIVARGNPKGVHAVSDMVRPDVHLGLGDPRACPVGCVATQILHNAGIAPESIHAQESLTVNELGVWVKMKNVDAAIVWDAIATNIAADVETIAIPQEIRVDSAVVLVRLAQSRNPDAAGRFIAFVKGADGQALLHAAGYRPPAGAL